MNVLIVEDDKIQRENLKKLINNLDKDINIYESEDKDQALVIANNCYIDIFYIDIFLKKSSGLDLAIEIRKMLRYEFSFIIFLTTHIEYITQAFKQVHCYDYILKPYDVDDVVNITKRFILHGYNSRDDSKDKRYVILPIRNGLNIRLCEDEILFIEVNIRNCMVHAVNGVYEINNLSMKNVLKLIKSNSIVQCHKSFAVNVRNIKRIENINSKLSEIYFENYDKNALLGYKFKNTIMEWFK